MPPEALPKWLKSLSDLARLNKLGPFINDEAHAILQWYLCFLLLSLCYLHRTTLRGLTFRPGYLNLLLLEKDQYLKVLRMLVKLFVVSRDIAHARASCLHPTYLLVSFSRPL